MKTILVVEAIDFLRGRLMQILAEQGFEVIEVGSGDHALDAYLFNHPDIVLIDLNLPGKNGLDVLRNLRAQDPDARIIVLSALGQEQAALEAMRCGARDFIIKPFQQDRVVSSVEAFAPERS